MAQHVTESIWHFIGYMHLEELLSRTPIHYSGAKAYDLQTIDYSEMAPLRDEPIDPFDGGRETRALEVKLPPVPPVVHADPLHVAAARPSPLLPFETERVPTPPPVNPAPDLSIVLPAETAGGRGSSPGAGGDNSAPPTIGLVSATYVVGADQLSDLHIDQANALADADIMRGDRKSVV